MSVKPLSNHKLNILVTRTDRIGDFLLSTPVFSAIKEAYPSCRLAGLTFLTNQDLIKGNPYLDEVILYDKSGSEKGLLGNLKFARALAKRKFDIVIHLHATNRMHLISLLAAIPVRIGWDRRAGWALSDIFRYVKKEGKKHEALYNFDLLKPLGIEAPKQLQTYFPIQNRAMQSVEEFLSQQGVKGDKPWVVINASASNPSKMWPLENFVQVARELHEKYEVHLFAIGTQNDYDLNESLKKQSQTPIFNFAGKFSLAMLGVFLKFSTLLISNDSGPVHLAQAVDTDVISIFVRTKSGINSDRWKPLGSSAVVLNCAVDAENDPDGLYRVRPEQVLQVVEEKSILKQKVKSV